MKASSEGISQTQRLIKLLSSREVIRNPPHTNNNDVITILMKLSSLNVILRTVLIT